MNAYDDIINLPHHVSQKHPQMPMLQRAALFAPFAALTGHDKALEDTAYQHEKLLMHADDSLEAE